MLIMKWQKIARRIIVCLVLAAMVGSTIPVPQALALGFHGGGVKPKDALIIANMGDGGQDQGLGQPPGGGSEGEGPNLGTDDPEDEGTGDSGSSPNPNDPESGDPEDGNSQNPGTEESEGDNSEGGDPEDSNSQNPGTEDPKDENPEGNDQEQGKTEEVPEDEGLNDEGMRALEQEQENLLLGTFKIDRSSEPGWEEKVDVTNATIETVLKNGGRKAIILTEDITLTKGISNEGDLTIFGDGHTITFGKTARIDLNGSGKLKVYDLSIHAATENPSTNNNGSGVFCANASKSGTWTADFYSITFSGAALVGSNVIDGSSQPKNFFERVAFYESNDLTAKEHRGYNAVVFAQNVIIGGDLTMHADSSITTNQGARVGRYFKSPGTSASTSENAGANAAYGRFEIAEDANVTITRSPNSTGLDNIYVRSVIYGYQEHYFGNNSSFSAKASTNRASATALRSAIIRSEDPSAFTVSKGAQVTLETDESILSSGKYGFTALLLNRKSAPLNFTVEKDAVLDITAKGNFGATEATARAYAPVMIMGTRLQDSTVKIEGTMNIASENTNGWYYEYYAPRSYQTDTFTIDGGQVNITANGREGNREATPLDEYAAFEHYNDNTFNLNIRNAGIMQINVIGWRAMSLAGTALSKGEASKSINIDGYGSQLLINPDGSDGRPTGYAQLAIAAEGIITFNLNITNGGEMYARNTQDSNIYTVGNANYNIIGSGSKLTLIKTGTNSTGANKYSLYGAIFHDTKGPLKVNVMDGGYMWVESSYGSRAAICAQTYSEGQSNITVDGSGSQLYVINRNTDLRNYLKGNQYIEDTSLYPLGAIAFAANTSGNVIVSNGADFYAESHNPISPTIALGAYSYSTPTGVFTADSPGEIDIRNDGTIKGSNGAVDIRGIALRGRNNYGGGYLYSDLGKGTLLGKDDAKTIVVANSSIRVYERNGGYDKSSFEDWGNEHVIRYWGNTSFSSMNLGTTGSVTNLDGSSGANGEAVASGTTSKDTDFTLNDYGRIYLRGIASTKTVDESSDAGKNGAAVQVGDKITYKIEYVNYRDVVADLVITDVLPADLKYISHTGKASVNGSTITWELENIGPGESGQVTLVAEVTGAASKTVTNKAQLDWTFVGDSTAKQEPSVTNPVVAYSAKYVSVHSKAGQKGQPVRLGDEITYEIRYVNNTGKASDVTITDTLPDSVAYVSSDGSFDQINNTVTWDIEKVPAGGSGTASVTVRVVHVTDGGKIINAAQIEWAAEPGVSPETPEIQIPIGASKYVAENSDAGIGGSAVKAGDVITYAIKYVNNTGEDNATVVIKDPLAKSLTYVGGSATGDGTSVPNLSFSKDNNTLTWEITDVAKDGFGTILFQAKVAEDLSGIDRIVNKANLTWQTSGGTILPDEAEATNPAINVTGSAKYVSSQSQAGVDGTPVYVGDIITYTIAYVNNNGEAADLVIQDTLSKGLKFISCTDGGKEEGNTVTWEIKNVSVGGNGTVSITAQVTEEVEASIRNEANLTWTWDGGSGSDQEKPGTENPVGSSKYIHSGSKSGQGGKPVTAGDEITYEIKYVNNTGAEASLTITDTLPKGVAYVSHTDESGEMKTDGGSPLQWTFHNVPAGGAGTVQVTVKVTEEAAKVTEIVNHAELIWDKGGSDTEKEDPEIVVPVGSIKYIAKGNGAGGVPVHVDDELTYTISYVNNTGGNASVTISDIFPKGVLYVSSTGGGLGMGDRVKWEISDVAAGASGVVTVTVKITEDAGTQIHNQAQVSWKVAGGSDETEAPETNNPVINGASKSVSAESPSGVDGAPVRLGDEIIYEIKYVNNTGDKATVKIIDQLPVQVEHVAHSGEGTFVKSENTLTWEIQDVPADGKGTVTVTVRVIDVAKADKIVNSARVIWNGNQDESEQPEASNPVGSSKYVAEDSLAGQNGVPVNPGDKITYEIKYVNNTGEDNVSLTITDELSKALVYEPGTATQGEGVEFSEKDGTLTWVIKGIAKDASGTVRFTATVGDISGIAFIVNNASLEWSAGGKILPEDAESTNPAVNPTKSSKYVSENSAAGFDGEAVHVGDLITYDILYVNGQGTDADLIIKDTLGKGLEFVSATQGGKETPEGSGSIQWQLDNIKSNATGIVSVVARVTDAAEEKVVNNVSFSWSVEEESPAEETASAENPMGSRKSIESINGVDAEKDTVIRVGDLVTYKISYINRTGQVADVTITDKLCDELQYISNTGDGKHSPVTNKVVWSIEGVEPDQGGEVTVTVYVTDKIGSTVVNSANVNWNNGSSGEENPSIVTPVASSKYVKAGSTGENGKAVHIGDEITYEIRYINNTGEIAELTIEDALPNGLEYVSHTDSVDVQAGTPSDTPSGKVISWKGTVQKEASGVVLVTVRVTEDAPSEITNTAKLMWKGTSSGTSETEDPSTTNPVGTTKYISSEAGKDGAKVSVGDEITYTIWYANKTGKDADLQIEDMLQDGLQYVSHTKADGNPGDADDYNAQTNTVVWNIEKVKADATGFVTITVKITSEASGHIRNEATVNWKKDGGDEEPEKPPVVINPINSTKYVSADSPGANGTPVAIGQEITYTIQYVNNHSAAAYVTITDTLSQGLKYVSSTPAAITVPSGEITWEKILVNPGQSGSVQISAVVTKDAIKEGNVSNMASFAWEGVKGEDLDGEKSTAENLLKTSKFVSKINGDAAEGNAQINIDDRVTYEILYMNHTGETSDVIITDVLAKGLQYLSSSDNGKEANGTVLWTIKDVAPGTGGSVTVQVSVTDAIEPDESGMITNVATVKWNTQEDPETPGTVNPVGNFYTVTYDANGGTGSYKDTGIKEGTSYRILTNTATGISRSGYTFTGWSDASKDGVQHASGSEMIISGDVTLYAQWSYDGGNGGGGGTKPDKPDPDKPKPTDPEKPGTEDPGTKPEGPGGSEKPQPPKPPVIPSGPTPSTPDSTFRPEADGSLVEISHDGVPLGRWTQDENGVWIYDQFPPLAGLIPQTGVDTPIGMLLLLAFGALLAIGVLIRRRDQAK